jgi:hypothetical protein
MGLASSADRRLSRSHCGLPFPRLWSCHPTFDRGKAEMTPTHEISVARALSTAELEALSVLREIRELGAFVLIDVDGCMYVCHGARVPTRLKSRLATYCSEAAAALGVRSMRRTFNGHEILQVTRAQCPACGARSVFSVLVAESGDAGDRNGRRAFYTCDRALLTRCYSCHDCERETAADAA